MQLQCCSVSSQFEKTDKQLASFASLAYFTDILKASQPEAKIIDFIPKQFRGSHKNILKFKQIFLAMDVGTQYLSNIDTLNRDPGFVLTCGGRVYSSKSCGDFLRLFSTPQCKLLGQKLIDYAYDVRHAVVGKTDSITFDIDSTSSKQYGLKMEGARKNRHGDY